MTDEQHPMVGKKYQMKSSMQLVIVTGSYDDTRSDPDDPPGIYYQFWEGRGDKAPTHWMSQSSVPLRLEGPICERCDIVKAVPGSHLCGSCGEAV